MTDTRLRQRAPGDPNQNRVAQREEAEMCYYAQVQQEKQTQERKKRIMYEWERRGDKKIGQTSATVYKENGARSGPLYDWAKLVAGSGSLSLGDKTGDEEFGYREDGTRSTPLYNWPGSASGSGEGTRGGGGETVDQELKTNKKGKGKSKGKGKEQKMLTFKEDEPMDEQELADDEEREMYLLKWASLLSTDDNDVQTELRYADIPWPIYNPSPNQKPNPHHLSKASIQSFLSDLALFQCNQIFQSEATEAVDLQKEEKKVLREAIKNYHPDRFLSKILPRVREREQEKVRAGMENCSRVLTELIMENSQ
jgi:hypothetical protein